MITGRDCRKEYEYAKSVVKTEEGKALLKTNEVNNKLLLNIRLMLVKLMEKLGVDKIQPRLPRTDETQQPVGLGKTTVAPDEKVEDVKAE